MEVRLQLSSPGWPKSLNWALIWKELTGIYCLTKHNYYSTCITGSVYVLLAHLSFFVYLASLLLHPKNFPFFSIWTTTFRKALLPPEFFTFKMEKFDLLVPSLQQRVSFSKGEAHNNSSRSVLKNTRQKKLKHQDAVQEHPCSCRRWRRGSTL